MVFRVGQQFRITPIPCPACGQTLNGAGATSSEERAPEVGDITVCFHCVALLQWTDGLGLRALTKDTLDAIALKEPADVAELRKTAREITLFHLGVRA